MYKAIKDYEGIYEVNELGQVRSVDRIVKLQNGGTRKLKVKELKLQMDNYGYTNVILSKNGIHKVMKVHRLVAETFLPNPDNLPQVHHINHDRKYNRVENLKWVTEAGQIDDHWKEAKSKAKTKGTRLRVVGNDIDKIFISAHEAERELGVDHSAAFKVAKGMRKQAKGYKIYFSNQETETNNA